MDIAANMVVGACLKKHREERDLTQRELADLLGKTQSFISKIETGERRLSVIEFINYTMALDGKIDVFVEEIHLGLVSCGYLPETKKLPEPEQDSEPTEIEPEYVVGPAEEE